MQVSRFVMRRIGSGAKRALPLLLLFLAVAVPAHAQEGGNQAGLVVVHGDGRVVTRCVRFDEAQISGLTLLQRSGIAFSAATGPMGSTICSVNGEGCPTSDCWCECKGTPCTYWIYFQRNPDGSWAYANVGAAMRQLGNGDVDGWMWGDTSSVPPAVSFDAICGVAELPQPSTSVPTGAVASSTAVAPTSVPIATATSGAGTVELTPPSLTPTRTLQPSATPTASPAAVPVTRTATPAPASPENEIPTATSAATATVDATANAGVPAPEPSGTSGFIAFAAILGAVGGVSLLLRHRRRGM